jgi:aspartate oxidase
MASYVMCLWLINPSLGLADLVAPAKDHAALEREVAKVRQQRTRKPSASPQAQPISAKTKPNEGELAAMREFFAKSQGIERDLATMKEFVANTQPKKGELAAIREFLSQSNPTAAGLAALMAVSGSKSG